MKFGSELARSLLAYWLKEFKGFASPKYWTASIDTSGMKNRSEVSFAKRRKALSLIRHRHSKHARSRLAEVRKIEE